MARDYILIIERDAELAYSLKKRLSSEGYRTGAYQSLRETLERIPSSDLVLLGDVLDELPIDKVLGILRDSDPSLPIVAMSKDPIAVEVSVPFLRISRPPDPGELSGSLIRLLKMGEDLRCIGRESGRIIQAIQRLNTRLSEA